MNKGIIIGGVVIVIIAIIIVVANSSNSESYNESILENSNVDESSTEIGISENKGRDISVELSESVGISSVP